ncbi:MAG TPA: FAD binding domain-containing protein [Candidatus Dormibacteraeota bacterium]|nr:FAD binding domain-containing protein [Candidatus Dormibacteraeota bacterium]
MKPPPLRHHAPHSVADAARMLAELDDAKVLAGGQSLVPLLNFRLARPSHLVDVNGLDDELGRVYERDGGVAVGAVVRQANALRHPLLHQRCPLVPLALRHVAHGVVRNRGTVCGSLAHGDPAAELPAALLAAGGHVVARSVRGERVIPAAELFMGAFETALAGDELIVEAWFPALAAADVAVVEESRRHGDFAMAGVARAGERLALFGVAATPVLADPRDPGRGLAPSGDLEASAEFKLQLVRVLVERALQERAAKAPLPSPPPTGGRANLSGFVVNGVERARPSADRRLLSDYLRGELGLTGTHVGCEHGVCGCCTVLLDGRPVRSCLMLAVQAEGHEVTTIEGLAGDGPLHPVQQAFHECHGLQCGFCTPGFVLAVTGLLAENPAPSEAEIDEGIAGNLCRCTGYASIRRSVRRAAELLR